MDKALLRILLPTNAQLQTTSSFHLPFLDCIQRALSRLSISSMSMFCSSATSRPTTAISFRDCHNGIGVKVIGGVTESANNGVFIKRIIRNGLAHKDGRSGNPGRCQGCAKIGMLRH